MLIRLEGNEPQIGNRQSENVTVDIDDEALMRKHGRVMGAIGA